MNNFIRETSYISYIKGIKINGILKCKYYYKNLNKNIFYLK